MPPIIHNFCPIFTLFANLRWGQSIIAIDLCTRSSGAAAAIPCIFNGDERKCPQWENCGRRSDKNGLRNPQWGLAIELLWWACFLLSWLHSLSLQMNPNMWWQNPNSIGIDEFPFLIFWWVGIWWTLGSQHLHHRRTGNWAILTAPPVSLLNPKLVSTHFLHMHSALLHSVFATVYCTKSAAMNMHYILRPILYCTGHYILHFLVSCILTQYTVTSTGPHHKLHYTLPVQYTHRSHGA